MKNLLFTIAILFLSFEAFTCGFVPLPFCEAMEALPEDHIIYGKILSFDEDGMDFEVIDVLRGEESKSIIRIWDGTDFDCNGIWPMDCTNLGEVDETVILILTEITEVENTWDVIGDYRRQNPYDKITNLKVINGKAEGFIEGDAFAPPSIQTLSFYYDKLKDIILNGGNCSDIIMNTKSLEINDHIQYNNPITSTIHLQLDELKINQVKIYSTNGRLVKDIDFNNQKQVQIPFENARSGLYFVEIITTTNQSKFLKVLKQ